MDFCACNNYRLDSPGEVKAQKCVICIRKLKKNKK